MSLYDNRYGTTGNIYGDVSGIPAQAQERKMMAQRLLSQYGEMPQGQMISGHYVAPSWTQQLAAAIKGPLARSEINAANKQLDEYGAKKRQDIAAILSGQTPQTVTTSKEEQYLPAYEPSQMDRFGSPTQPREMQTRTVESSRTETPEEVQARLRPLIYQAASQFGNDPALQLALGDLNYGRQRADTRADVQEGRTYQEGQQAVQRQQHLDDVANQQEFQRIMMKDQQGFQTTQQEKQFAQQYQMQKAQQQFAAQQQAQNQQFTAGQNALNRQQAINSAQAKAGAKTMQTPEQIEQATISAQQALNQAGTIYNHPGKNIGTGITSGISAIPGTDARGFKANLDTFKAQTFVPMVSALKGMGALSDAEGKKLADSVGALDPGMKTSEFNNSLKEITRTLYKKAKASGLNVDMPSFAAEDSGASGGWGIQEIK